MKEHVTIKPAFLYQMVQKGNTSTFYDKPTKEQRLSGFVILRIHSYEKAKDIKKFALIKSFQSSYIL